MKRTRFTTDSETCPSFPCFDDGVRWNGWMQPLVTWQTARKARRHLPGVDVQEGSYIVDGVHGTWYRLEGCCTYEV